jgi:hypothetical protein
VLTPLILEMNKTARIVSKATMVSKVSVAII